MRINALMENLSNQIIAAVIGAISGGLGSFFGPWGNWRFEEKKLLREERKAALADLRFQLTLNKNVYDFYHLAELQRVKKHFKKDALKKLESLGFESTHTIEIGTNEHRTFNPYYILVSEEISRLEKKWNLV